MKEWIKKWLPCVICELAAAAAFAEAVAVPLKTVWGTRRGIRGTSLLPSAAHSEHVLAPKILKTDYHKKRCFKFHISYAIKKGIIEMLERKKIERKNERNKQTNEWIIIAGKSGKKALCFVF